jgi:hypothetical protein
MLALAVLSGAVNAMRSDAAGRVTTSNPLVRAGSASHQFTAYASDPLSPPVLCVFAERVKRGWLDHLDLRDHWRDPIVIVVRERGPTELDAPAVSMETVQFDIGLSYRVRCLTPPPLDEARLRAALVTALCTEWANRSQPTTYRQPFLTTPLPLWLVEGLTQSVSERTELLGAVVRRSVDAGHPAHARDLLETTALPADAAECELFQANAWLFTESLLTLRDGAHTLQRLLTELAAQKSVTGAFWTVYRSDFQEPIALEKWWAVQLAHNRVIQPAQSLTAAETTRQLDELLHVTVRQADGSTNEVNLAEQPPEFLWRQAGQEWLKAALKDRIQRLEALRSQAHPRYRTVIERYVAAQQWWLAKKLVRGRAAFEQARKERQEADQQMLEIAVVLDRAERTYTQEDFGVMLRDQLSTLDQFQQLERQHRTPISNYLDQLDQ